MAVGVAFAAQWLLTGGGSVRAGWILFAVASAGALAGFQLLDRVTSASSSAPPEVRLEPWRWSSARRITATSMIVTGAGAALTAALIAPRSDRDALAAWLAAIALVVAGAALGARNRIRLARPSRPRLAEGGIVAAILGLAVALRLPDLSGIPAFVHGDEAAIGLEARRILAGGTVFSFGWAQLPSLSYAIPAATMRVLGDDLAGLRMASLIQGVLSVLVLYLLVRRLFGRRPALLAAALLAVSAWDIHFSRQGSHYMQAQLATLLVFFFLFRALDTRRALDFLLCGLAVGLCFEVYYAARLAPAIAALVLLQQALDKRGFVREHAVGLVALAFGAAVFLAPMWSVATHDRQAWNARSRDVSLLQGKNIAWEKQVYGVDSNLDVLRLQTIHTLEAFNRTGETSLQYGRRGPLLDFWTAALLPLGAILVLVRTLATRYFLLSSWVVASLVFGSILTIDAPFSPRLVALIPALMIPPALALDAIWSGISSAFGRYGVAGFAAAVAALLGLSLVANQREYFDRFTKREHPADFNTVLSHYLARTGPGYRYYLIGVDGPSLRYDTQHFLVPWVDGQDVGAKALRLPVPRPAAGKGVAFVVEAGAPDAVKRLGAIERAYPLGVLGAYRDRLGQLLFTSYAVTPAALEASS
jgi:4-amino-4-deoxy-L-arabinose transferase-like glycosyltransferase